MIYNVYRWSAIRDRLQEHDQALAHLAAHIRDEHPLIKGLKSWKVLWGSDVGRPGRIWVECFESMAAYEEHGKTEYTAACDAAWAPVFATTVEGSATTSVWEALLPDSWFDR